MLRMFLVMGTYFRNMLKYFLSWLPMLVIAVINGAARDLLYKKYTGELLAHQVSTITLLILFGFYVWFIIGKWPPHTSKEAIFMGRSWVVMTLLFEFGFGLMLGNAWEKLLGDYNVFERRIWVLIPVWTAITPLLFFNFCSESKLMRQ
jgi:hypothetical protein